MSRNEGSRPMDIDEYVQQAEDAIARHAAADGSIPAGKVAQLAADITEIVHAAYGQGLEDAY